MPLEWLSWSNPVSIWWCFLVSVSIINIALWIGITYTLKKKNFFAGTDSFPSKTLVALSAVYVFVCAFRSILPRADVQRICLFNTWLSSILVGRSLATIAEICFALQWVIILHYLSVVTSSSISKKISYCVVPLIMCAECCSWYAVLTTNYLGNAIENSIWAATFFLVAVGLFVIQEKFKGQLKRSIWLIILGILCFIVFECSVDVPMYIERWQASMATGTPFLSFGTGLRDISSHWVVTYTFAQWSGEMLWMSLYFSVAVWMSLALCCFIFVKNKLPTFLKD